MLPPLPRHASASTLAGAVGLLALSAGAVQGDDYMYQRQEGTQRGWDYYGPDDELLGYSEENTVGGLDYRDNLRAWDGHSELNYMGQLIEYTADDSFINLNYSDYNDGYMYIQHEGKVYWMAVNNYTGGRDYYDEFGIIHASSDSLYYNWYYTTDELPYTELKITHMDEWGY
jgi:hypothetical protein